MNKSQMLKNIARLNGLCNQWYFDWNDDCSDEDLLDKAELGMHFLCKHNYPDVASVRSLFDKEQLKKHNIYLDQEVTLGNFGNNSIKNKDILLMGNTKGVVIFNGYAVANVYVMNDCDITIECNNLCKVFVTASGNAKLTINANDASSVFVYQYGDITCKTKGDVKIKDRRGIKVETIK